MANNCQECVRLEGKVKFLKDVAEANAVAGTKNVDLALKLHIAIEALEFYASDKMFDLNYIGEGLRGGTARTALNKIKENEK